jgi:hypothetical protein
MAADRDSRADGGAKHWAQRLGEQRHVQDECAVRAAEAEEEDATRMNAVSLQRWQGIVACIRKLIDAYNAGANRVVLNVFDEPGQRAVTVRAGDEHAPYLTAMLDHTLICSQGRDSSGVAHASELRLRPDRDDEATAAYVLQHWMQHL